MWRVDSFWDGLGAGGEGDDRGWDDWMASPTPWTWVWVNSGSWWWTGRPGMLRFMGSQRVGHDWATELNWTLGKGHSETEVFPPFKRKRERLNGSYLSPLCLTPLPWSPPPLCLPESRSLLKELRRLSWSGGPQIQWVFFLSTSTFILLSYLTCPIILPLGFCAFLMLRPL